MTPEEKQAQMTARNAAICAYYTAGHKVAACASTFRLGRQRVLQILQAAGVWKPYEKQGRDKFLGINVTEQTKIALKDKAGRDGISVSQLASNALDAAVGGK